MLIAVIIVFILGYVTIVIEHPLKLDKTVPALIMGALCWALIALGHLPVYDHELNPSPEFTPVLLHHIGKIAEILVFLLGAMTIVELIDLHRGFDVITNRINTTSKKKMLWLITILSFFMSATLDNLACTIVLVSLLRRLVPRKRERIWFVCLAVIGANAGGAWSPIGDVTTTMLWIGNKVSSLKLIEHVFIPSILCALLPAFILSFTKPFRGNISHKYVTKKEKEIQFKQEQLLSSKTMLIAGVGALIFVPIFKAITHLPPYIGMMLGLGIVWAISEYIHPEEKFDPLRKQLYSAHRALSRIELSSILFFLGILVAVSSLESLHLLQNLAEFLDHYIPSKDIVIMVIGVFSAVIDNVPLVAAAMGMYTEPMDATTWHFIAFAAGTGGSMLIIGSAAGVAAMGMEKINFIWYLKRITFFAFIGFFIGCLYFIATKSFF